MDQSRHPMNQSTPHQRINTGESLEIDQVSGIYSE